VIIGVLGGGQLGRMLALAGIPLGLRFRFLDPDPKCPASTVGELVVGKYDDPAALERLSNGVDVVTYEFENIPAAAARQLAQRAPVYPPESALATAQDRVSEKTCFNAQGIGTAPWAAVDTRDDLHAAVKQIGLPSVLKTRRFGYDGKGQAVLRSAADIESAWTTLGEPRVLKGESADLVLEGFVRFTREISLLGVRGRDGTTAFYPPVWNIHHGGILSRSESPSPDMSGSMQHAIEDATRRVMDALNYVGVLAVEYFDLGDGTFLANEMAPRVHNSGHWSIEGAVCSQFENHVRAIAGLPLGDTRPRSGSTSTRSVMYNIVGAHPPVRDVLDIPGACLHLYGKSERPGRKLGHVTVSSADSAEVDEACAALELVLDSSGSRPRA
jgi:5-(carboxyamino)imidazole ribonucleotide synthase